MMKFLTLMCAAVGLVTGLHAAFIDRTAFEHVAIARPSGYEKTSVLHDYPLLLRLSTARLASFIPADCGAGGAELRFTDAGGTLLPFEIDEWHPEGESLVWVKVPELYSDSVIFIYWKLKSGKTLPANDPKQVWSDYVGVWHFNETDGDIAHDSSPNGFHAFDTTRTSTPGVAGKVGRARQMNNGELTTGVRQLTDSSLPRPLMDATRFTYMGWVQSTATIGSQQWPQLMNKGGYVADGGWYMNYSQSPTRIDVVGGAANAAQFSSLATILNAWQYLSIRHENKRVYLSYSGVQKANVTYGSGDITAPKDNANYALRLLVGITGYGDELRIATAMQSDDWAWADWKSMNDASFVTYSSAPALSADLEPIQMWDGGDAPVVHPVVRAADGRVLTEGTDYTLTQDTSAAKIGTRSVTVTGLGVYAGTTLVVRFYALTPYAPYGATVYFVSPDAPDSGRTFTSFADGGTLQKVGQDIETRYNSTGWDKDRYRRVAIGTAALPVVIVLKSGTDDAPAVYDYSGKGAVANQSIVYMQDRPYIHIRTQDFNPRHTIIRGGGQSNGKRLLYFYGVGTMVAGVTIQNFYRNNTGASLHTEYGMGSAIYGTYINSYASEAQQPLVTNCIFRSNSGYHAVVGVMGKYVDCLFVDNVQVNNNGGQWVAGCVWNAAWVRNCVFSNNTVKAGGLVSGCNQSTHKNVTTVDACLFAGNSGAGKCVATTDGTTGAEVRLVTNCVFRSNTCQTVGGKGWVADCRFETNTSAIVASDMSISNSVFIANSGYVNNMTCTGCQFLDTLPGSSSTAGIASGGNLYDCVLQDAALSGRKALNDVRDIHRCFITNLMCLSVFGKTSSTAINVKDSIVLDCTLTGALLQGSATNCLFSGNATTASALVEGGDLAQCTFAGNRAGTGIRKGGTTVNCVIIGNQASYDLWQTTAYNTLYGLDYGGSSTTNACVVWDRMGAAYKKPDANHPWGGVPTRHATAVDIGRYLPGMETASDLSGTNRIYNFNYGGKVDAGCYEFHPEPGTRITFR